jgi:hypothetical protein
MQTLQQENARFIWINTHGGSDSPRISDPAGRDYPH